MIRPAILIGLAFLGHRGALAQFPPGYDCTKFTNERVRGECFTYQSRGWAHMPNPSAPAQFPPGYDCTKFTNDRVRADCLASQSRSGADMSSIEAPRRPAAPPVQVAPREPELASTGTGFFVSTQGHVLSNAHVVEGCVRVVGKRAAGPVFPLEVLTLDKANDLAVLQGSQTTSIASFRRGGAPLGESITIFGFPLAGALANSGNLTTGSISGLAGLTNDPSRYQISAPIQPGNSGGAVLDESGAVVGVVVSKLDVMRAQRVLGDLPQNVNFAVKGSVAQNFLEANGIRHSERSSVATRRVKDIAEEAMRFTVLVACFK